VFSPAPQTSIKKIVALAICLLFLSVFVGQSAKVDNRKAGDSLELTIKDMKNIVGTKKIATLLLEYDRKDVINCSR
jgi:hypothetical protein